jgi:chromosome segregation protein
MTTGNALAGIDYGDEGQPLLVARRADGERVQVAGLSEGTHGQLFLALRFAQGLGPRRSKAVRGPGAAL